MKKTALLITCILMGLVVGIGLPPKKALAKLAQVMPVCWDIHLPCDHSQVGTGASSGGGGSGVSDGCDGGPDCNATICDDGRKPHCYTCENGQCQANSCTGDCLVSISSGSRICEPPKGPIRCFQ